MAWVHDGKALRVKCDVCGKDTHEDGRDAEVLILIGAEVIAEVCKAHAAQIRTQLKKLLKTEPGGPKAQKESTP